MEYDIYEAFSSTPNDDDQLQLNFHDPDEQPSFDFEMSSST